MTDREMLQSLKSMIDAQLGTNVIPVVPVVPPAVVPVTHTGNPLLDAYALSNPIGTDTGGVTISGGDYLEDADYDIKALNGPRRYTNGNNTHFIRPDKDGKLTLHVGKMSGNVADAVRIAVWTTNISNAMDIPTTDQVLEFDVKIGVRYGISISQQQNLPFALSIRAELA